MVMLVVLVWFGYCSCGADVTTPFPPKKKRTQQNNDLHIGPHHWCSIRFHIGTPVDHPPDPRFDGASLFTFVARDGPKTIPKRCPDSPRTVPKRSQNGPGGLKSSLHHMRRFDGASFFTPVARNGPGLNLVWRGLGTLLGGLLEPCLGGS